MQEIVITYKHFGLFQQKFTRQYPEDWPEVTPGQLITIAKFYMQEGDDDNFIAGFFNIPVRLARRLDRFMIYKLLDCIDFIRNYKPRDSFIIKKLATGAPPKPRLNGLTFGQFIFIDTYFNDYAVNADGSDQALIDAALNKFIATLYWPPRQRFNENKIAQRAAIAAGINPEVKQAVAINYRLVKDWLTESYPLIFSKAVETKGDPKNAKKESGWLKVFDSIVDDDIINSDKYAGMLLHDVLRYITRKIKENAKRP